MSTPWDAHLAQLISKTPNARCAMFGHDGTQWTSSSIFNTAEIKALLDGFKNPASLFPAALAIEGVKFMTTRADDNLIVLKHQQEGVVAIKTTKTCVVCHFTENNLSAAQANLFVQAFADYLERMGF